MNVTVRPRRFSDANSARYTAPPPYSPPAENPCRQRRNNSSSGAATPIAAKGRQQPDRQCRAGHQQDDEGQHALPPDPVAEWPEDEPAERSHEERRHEYREGVQQGRGFIS
jgi:hypothetical protein